MRFEECLHYYCEKCQGGYEDGCRECGEGQSVRKSMEIDEVVDNLISLNNKVRDIELESKRIQKLLEK